MVAGGHRIIVGDVLNLVVSSSLSTPTHRHTLVTYTLIDNRTTSTINRTGTTIQLYNHRTTESVGSTKELTNFVIYTACCCSASNLAFHAFEYLASLDPDKPLSQDGWAMGEMQKNFQHKLRSMRYLCCVVCSERWYTTQQCLDPALYVWVNIPFSKTKTKRSRET